MTSRPTLSVLTTVFTVVITAQALYVSGAEIRFGLSSRMNLLNHARQGKFFASSDLADSGYDYGEFTRGKTGGTFPSNTRPWCSDGSATLFGVRFPQPIPPNRCPIDPARTPADLFEHWFEDGVPRFDQLQIFWGEQVPEPSTWSAAIRTPDGQIVRLNIDRQRRIYPFDRTTIHFDPLPVDTIYVGIRERKDKTPNFVSVRDIRLNLQEVAAQNVTNYMIVAQPDLYRVHYSPNQSGLIDWLSPVNRWQTGPTAMLRWLTPFVEIGGKTLEPIKKPYPVSIETEVSAAARNSAFALEFSPTAPTDMTLRYTLQFENPGNAPVQVAVTTTFGRDPEKQIIFALRADTLPEGARIGYRLHGPEQVFGAIADATPELSGNPILLSTPAGRLTFDLKNASGLTLKHIDGPLRARDWEDQPVRFVQIEARADGPEMTLALGLPIGLASKPPETQNFDWRPSLATESELGAEALAPFRTSDLELMEEIDVGNPNDPHAFIDSRNDPIVAAALKKNGPDWRPPSGQTTYGFLPFIENPEEGAVPLVEIDGHPCRAIPDKMGSYFRYDLQSHFSPRTPYLVVVDHAFDQLRRGAFYSVTADEKTENLFWTRGLYGGFETNPNDAKGGFRREYVLCYFTGLSHQSRPGRKNSLVFANKVHSGPWQKTPGLAIRRIQIYRVKNLPALPDFAPLLPDPAHQRSVIVWSEHDRGSHFGYLFDYPKLLGYSTLWTHIEAPTKSFGGSPVSMTDVDQWAAPGTLAGNRMLFEAAEAEGMTVNIHLGQLLKIGFEGTDYESFLTATYMQDGYIPLKPTSEEKMHLAKALKNVLPTLARYRSLRDVATHFWPTMPFSLRNLRDFCAETGIPLNPSPLASDNIKALLNAGPETLDAWRTWACKHRFAFNEWLLGELRHYRPDLYITLTRFWDHQLIEACIGYDAIPGVDRRTFAASGIVTYLDYLRLFGIDPAQYAGRPGFALELEADARLRINKEIPDYFETDWFRELKAGFDQEGLGIMVHCASLEATGPLMYYNCPFVAPPLGYRRGLLRAFWFGNPRNITLGSYNEAWGARLQDFREFAVAYRLLPFAPEQPYAGTLNDPTGQAAIRRYGDRHGLANLGDLPTTVVLTVPAGCSTVTDLSDGAPQKLETVPATEGALATVRIPMKPWALKTLEIH